MLNPALLALRPTNVMHQLGADSPVPLFNARILLDGLAAGGRVLWAPRLPDPAAAPGVLRAAAHLRAPVGLVLTPGPDADPTLARRQARPGAVLQALATAADELDAAPPFCLHVQTGPVDGPGGERAAAAAGLVIDCIQAGFTSAGVDLTACPREAWAEVAEAVLAPALELELSTTVALPASEPAEVAAGVLELRRAGLEPDLVLIAGPNQIGDEAWELARGAAPDLSPARPAWPDCRPAPGDPPARPADASVAAVLAEPILDRRPAGGPPLDSDPERAEALAYTEALGRLEQLVGRAAVEPVLAHMVSLCG